MTGKQPILKEGMTLKKIKKVTAVLTALAMTASLFVLNLIPGYAAGADIVENGDIEGIAFGTTGNFTAGNSTVSVVQANTVTDGNQNPADSKYIHGGTKALKVTQDTAKTGEGAVNYNFSPSKSSMFGKTYKATAWVRYDETANFEKSANKKGFLYMRVAGTGKIDSDLYNARAMTPAYGSGSESAYTKLEYIFTINESDMSNTANSLRLNISSSAGAQAENGRCGETFYVDDVSITEVTGDENLLSDGSFEDLSEGTEITGTEVNSMVLWNGTGMVTKEKASDGAQSLKLTTTSNDSDMSFNYYVSLRKGKTYTVSMDVHEDGSAKPYLQMRDDNAIFQGEKTTSEVGANGFKTMTFKYTTEKDYSRARINFGLSQRGAGQVIYIDNLVLREEDGPAPTETTSPTETPVGENLLKNGDFEDTSVYPAGSEIAVGNTAHDKINPGNAVAAVIAKSQEPTHVNEGEQAIKLTYTDTTKAQQATINQLVALKKGVQYEISADVRYDESLPEDKANTFYIRMQDTANFTWDDRGETAKISGKDGFVTVKTTYTADKDYSSARFNVVMSSKEDHAVGYIDNLVVKVIGETPDSCVKEGNLIGENASFEMDDKNLPGVGNGTGVRDTAGPHRGKYALKVTRNSAENELGVNYGVQKLEAGKTYRFGAYVRYDEAIIDSSIFYVRFMRDSNDEPKGQLIRCDTPPISGSSNYTYLTAYYTPEKDLDKIRLNIGMGAKDGAVGYIDDVILEEVTPAAAVKHNIMTDGSFEAAVNKNLQKEYMAAGAAVSIVDDYNLWQVHSGNQALKVEQLNASGCIQIEKSGLNPGAYYTLGAWVRYDQSVTTADCIYIRNYYQDSKEDKVTASEKIDGKSSYVYVQHTAKSNDDGTLKFQIKSDTGDGDASRIKTFYVDDVSFVEEKPSIGGAVLQKEAAEDVWESVPLSDMSQGKRQFKVTGITNPTAEDFNLGVILALYDTNQVCVDVAVTKMPVAAGSKDLTASVQLNVPADAADKTLKSYVWNLDTMSPFEKTVKILVIGNSITQHSPAADKGWLGNWGMAATAPEKDYVHQLLAKAQMVNENAQMKWVNISEFEKYFYSWEHETPWDAFDIAKYQEYVDFDADIIICTVGANVKNPANEGDPGFDTHEEFEAADYHQIISHFNPGDDASVIVGLTTLMGGTIKDVIVQAAGAMAWPVVDMTDLTDNQYKAFPYEQQLKDAFGVAEIIPGVLNHPGDKGMQIMAERLWESLEPAMKKLEV